LAVGVETKRSRRRLLITFAVLVVVVVLPLVWLALQTLRGESSKKGALVSNPWSSLVRNEELQVPARLAHVHLNLLAAHEKFS